MILLPSFVSIKFCIFLFYLSEKNQFNELKAKTCFFPLHRGPDGEADANNSSQSTANYCHHHIPVLWEDCSRCNDGEQNNICQIQDWRCASTYCAGCFQNNISLLPYFSIFLCLEYDKYLFFSAVQHSLSNIKFDNYLKVYISFKELINIAL